MTSRNISGVVCSHGALPFGPIIPMLLTAMSSPPSLSAASRIMATRRLSSRASPTTAKAKSFEGWLSAAIRATVSSALSPLTSKTATIAPARASQTAISLPIPAPAPVTRALRPVRSIAIAMLFVRNSRWGTACHHNFPPFIQFSFVASGPFRNLFQIAT